MQGEEIRNANFEFRIAVLISKLEIRNSNFLPVGSIYQYWDAFARIQFGGEDNVVDFTSGCFFSSGAASLDVLK